MASEPAANASTSEDDQPDFGVLFERYFEPLTRQVARMVDCEHVAEELVQDVFLRMWSAREDLDIRGDLGSYLRRAARNRALDWLRREDRHREWERASRLEAGDLTTQIPGPGDDELSQLQAALAECLTQMPERRRIVCELRWRQEVGPSAIAARLGISVKTVESHIAYGTKHVRTRLQGLAQVLAYGRPAA